MTILGTALLALLPAGGCDAPHTSGLASGGLVWSFPAGLGPPTVVLGERGGQVLVRNTWEIWLLSAFDANPPVPVWHDFTGWGEVAARESDVFLSVNFENFTGSSWDGTVTRRTSSSPVPDWIHEFDDRNFVQVAGCVSRDGRVIIASAGEIDSPTSELRVLDPGTGVAIRTYVIPVSMARLALSPDGSIAAFSGAQTRVIDVGSGRELFATPGILPERQGLSNEGRVLVVQEILGNVAHVRAFVREGAGYREALDSTVPYVGFPIPFVLSDDGSTVAMAWYEFTTPGSFTVRAFDVASSTRTMERVFRVPDPYYWRCDLAIDADGSRFVVGSRGQGAEPTLALYSPTDVEPLVEYPAGGPVYSVDIAPDGDRFVASRYPANDTNTASVELYEFGGEDLVVRGRPSIGSTVEFELHATPGASAFLLSSPRLAATPLEVAGVGTLVLGRSLLETSSLGVVPPSGIATHDLVLANDPALVGRTTWYQGLTTGPRTLSRDWIQLTILP